MQMKQIFVIIFLVIISFSISFAQCLPQVSMQTVFGEIVLEIDTLRAPITAQNFLTHVENGTFENAVFYRTVRPDNQPNNNVKIEVIQGGVFEDEMIETFEPIFHETTKQTGLQHLNGTLSMARNKPGSASTEFFICIGNQPELDFGGKRNPDGQGFAAFGQVVEGMDVVRKIQQVKDNEQMMLFTIKVDITKKSD